MTSFMPMQPGQGLLRVSLLGPMGIGKTTALRSLCGELTTVGAEFGEIDLGSGERLQLVGSPGQDRFDFVRRWVLSASVGALLMVDVNDAGAVDYACEMLAGVAELDAAPLMVILSCRPASGARLEAFSSGLVAKGHDLIPLVEADPRDRQQMLDALSVLASLLSLQSQTL